ncbi:DUF3592 domain-containing protein [Asanoa siamensis]|uniref:DUF3592 domain-containing protein n=1 Tax=Asanoa siamensis TaxID=926357 RepID=A0ABQ4CJI0_9ACTN|nr:DUF3592 domain-containing protein [Asanoa siamensis]GIF71450.1 hypothetical protein Asi02nite_09680 [Asanoa siamensis]
MRGSGGGTRGDSWPWLAVYALLLVAGPTLAVTSAVHMHREGAKQDRLPLAGVPVTATVTDRDKGSSTSRDTTTVSYQVDGRAYTRTIRGLASGPTMTLWVDPTDPTAFVADNGSTDGSASGPNGWASVAWGVIFVALGVAGFVTHRRAKTRPGPPAKRPPSGSDRPAKDRPTAPPKRSLSRTRRRAP